MTTCTTMAARISAQGEHPIVEACFLELAEPDIATGGSRCVARGATRVLMVPYFLSAGVHLLRDLTRAREELASDTPVSSSGSALRWGRIPCLTLWWPPGSASSSAARRPPWLSQVTRSTSVTLRLAISDQGPVGRIIPEVTARQSPLTQTQRRTSVRLRSSPKREMPRINPQVHFARVRVHAYRPEASKE